MHVTPDNNPFNKLLGFAQPTPPILDKSTKPFHSFQSSDQPTCGAYVDIMDMTISLTIMIYLSLLLRRVHTLILIVN